MRIQAQGIVFLSLLACGCIVQSEPGPKGDPGLRGDPGPSGDAGPPGNPGVPDNTALSDLQTAVKKLQAQIDALQSKTDTLQSKSDALESENAALQSKLDAVGAQIADPDCPSGYAIAAKPFVPSNPDSVLCKNGVDEVVRIGRGGAAFWIDRYEASVWENPDGTGSAYGSGVSYPPTFPKNGQRIPTFVDAYAVSKLGVLPSPSATWFQAQQACRASGKRLPTGEEWLAAASGTNDPGPSNGAAGACVTLTNAGTPRITGAGVACVSGWGAEDMIGNLSEFTTEWYAAPGDGSGSINNKSNWGDPAYANDGTWNLASGASSNGANPQNVPAAALRGGNYLNEAFAGVFALSVGAMPTRVDTLVGFRCMLPR